MSSERVTELTTAEELREAYPVLEQLRPIGADTFLDVYDTMRAESGYQLFALRSGDGDIRALAGVVVETNMYHGKHAWVHELVVDEPHRGEGHGGELLSWVESWADDRDCSCVELASGHWRDRAHEFYEKEGMEKYCYTFKTELSADSLY
ncbi:GNAT family N-acetyltransferase [Halorientalis pallida]|uniref:GNAT family N-acetyltransferase n=1 Tax=Halorientalis pallida TaxID=2479928 RepID=A0A498KVU4_9EURY|nr:GNAT family N-acetyltransferase [Halorientalis pallida]RXK49327.1 GNAT family N-acetyltransferase [Halorientalis pallida]